MSETRRNQGETTDLPRHSSLSESLHQRLAALNQVTMTLTRSSSIEELYQSAVKLGISELGFDRLGLFLVDPNDPYRLTGTYGTDQTGQVVDEHHVTFRLNEDDWLMALVSGQTSALYLVVNDIVLFDATKGPVPQGVGIGWNAGAALWDGEEIIGYLMADNLLRQQPYTDFDGEVLALYAGTIGHLCLRLRSEEFLRTSHATERAFRTRLAELNRVAAQLMRAPDVDTLYRSVIELGRHELSFDRLGLWLYGKDRATLVGTYGTWLDGTLKDERHLTTPAAKFESRWESRVPQGYVVSSGSDVPLTTPETNIVSHGWSAVAALSDGEELIGYLSSDNLRSHQPYQEIDGELLSAYGHMIGPLITRQRIAEQLRERQAKYQALLNAVPDMLFILTRKGIYQDYYTPADGLLYVQPEFFLGKHVTEVLPSPLAEQVVGAIEEISTANVSVTLEYTLLLQEQVHSYEARLVPLDQDLILKLVRDVTDRKQLEEQLFVSQKMESLGRMASGIAHDFNNVLTVILGYASLAQRQVGEVQPKLSQALAKVIDASEKGMHLTQQLLSFARKRIVAPQIVDVRTMIQGMETMLRQILGDEIVLQVETDETPLPIKIDPGQFEQIVLNLTVNARDAMTKGDTFSIRCRRVVISDAETKRHLNAHPGTYVLMEVRDTGTGIPDELLSRIFEPFFSTKARGEGSGLGLAICHGIVEQNGGYILIESAPAVGTNFQIFLPHVDGEISYFAPTVPNLRNTGGETILIVEDDPVICELISDILRSHGYAVLPYTSGSDALQCAKEYSGQIDLLITDMMMPTMSGQELIEAMSRLYPSLPVLMVSGYMEEPPEQFLNVQRIKFLAKPYKSDELVAHVRLALTQ
ncbi:MAG: response regulator [Caldilineaceae bacterium]|nr:response regulator [Caldilineaceae bacterium]